jgi:hypothetical protein
MVYGPGLFDAHNDHFSHFSEKKYELVVVGLVRDWLDMMICVHLRLSMMLFSP